MVIFRFYLVCVIREADFVKYMFSFVLYGFHLVRWVLPLSMPQCILKPLGQVLHQLLAAGEQNSLVVSRISSQPCSSDRCFLLLVNCFMILQYTLPLKILCFWGHHKYLFVSLLLVLVLPDGRSPMWFPAVSPEVLAIGSSWLWSKHHIHCALGVQPEWVISILLQGVRVLTIGGA